MASEFRNDNISVNAIWPKTAIATAAVQNILGGDESMRRARKDSIMADSVYLILTTKAGKYTGNFFIVC